MKNAAGNYWRTSRRFMYRLGVTALVAFILSLCPFPSPYLQSVPMVAGVTTPREIVIPSPPDIPVNETRVPAPILSPFGTLIQDIPSGIVLYANQDKTRFSPASTTKLMSAIVAKERFDLDDVLRVATVVTEGRTMNLAAGEQLSFESLLYGALVHSANDATFTIAENYPGGVPAFVTRMNAKAQEMFLAETHFTNPIGFDDPNHYTTPRDLAKLAIMFLSDPQLAKIVATRAITVSDVTHTRYHPLTNVNQLLGKVPGMAGVKTGYTDNAGEVLVSQVKRDGHSVLFVVMNSPDRFGETVQLVDWVFSNIRWYPAETAIPANL